MLDVLTDRTPAIIAAWPRATQHCPEACRKRRSTAEPCPPWLIGSSVINILSLKAQVKHRVTPSPPRHYPVKFEITFCVRGVIAHPCLLLYFPRRELEPNLCIEFSAPRHTPMEMNENSRRSFLMQIGAASALAITAANTEALPSSANPPQARQAPPTPDQTSPALSSQAATRAARMAWWHQAKFGMFIHWGLYSVIGQHEWAKEVEGVPISQYELLAKHFHPKPNAAREWAKIAKRAGQKYMVMTTKHHEGFCHWDTKLTDYCAPKQGPGRDLVREYVDAARAEGLRVGFYYSLMDWHHPDGAKCKTDEEARKRFVAYTHGLIRELMTNYGKIDVLWYDVDWPLTAEGWESERMNQMVFDLQPEIIINNRNGLEGDFSTPEQEVRAAQSGRAWESYMTLNDSWGFNRFDDGWKTPKTIVANLANCARGGGNYLLNIGPKPDGSIPEETVTVLDAVGKWLDTNGKAIYGAERGFFS